MLMLLYEDEYEYLVDHKGKVLASGHKLKAEDVLFALGYRFHIEEVENAEDWIQENLR